MFAAGRPASVFCDGEMIRAVSAPRVPQVGASLDNHSVSTHRRALGPPSFIVSFDFRGRGRGGSGRGRGGGGDDSKRSDS